ncbi:hypothetical protein G7046_g6094 [Stylonectria norvegica]|nr:hypothetical protein G7046_g6094 [Stylonectria norvegica]
MEVDSENELLQKVASGGAVEGDAWPGLRTHMIARLDKIAHEEFPIPNLPPPPPPPQPPVSPLPSSPIETSSQEANKENEPEPVEELPATQPLEPGALPKQLADMLTVIVEHLEYFKTHPPHTIQRLAELVLQPRAHYKALATYLHAVDRVVQVTSGTNTYPLPLAVPDMSSMNINGEDPKDPAVGVAWSNPMAAALGTDEALGGALLTPIPWLARRSPESQSDTPGAQIHSESTETIDGPNGMGSIETVSVSVNGVPSTGHTRGVTQGELLRQEQRAGVVPVSQLSRAQEAASEEERARYRDEDEEQAEEEEEVPHARGPEEIGVGDTGLQAITTSHVGEGGQVEMQDIDVEAAVGRKHDDEDTAKASEATESEESGDIRSGSKSPGAESVGTKREADQGLEGEPAQKVQKEDDDSGDEVVGQRLSREEEVVHRTKETPAEEIPTEEADDKMETN